MELLRARLHYAEDVINADLSHTQDLQHKMAQRSHPLSTNFTFWSLNKKAAAHAQGNYEDNVKRISSVNTVEQFWRVYSCLERPNSLPNGMEFHFFRDGITPLWEDTNNRNGGKWVVRLKKGMASRCWEDTLLALIGEQFGLGDEICGAVVSTKFQEDVISVWNRTATDTEAMLLIRDTIKQVLGIPSNAVLEYKAHNQYLKQSVVKPLGGVPSYPSGRPASSTPTSSQSSASSSLMPLQNSQPSSQLSQQKSGGGGGWDTDCYSAAGARGSAGLGYSNTSNTWD
eukprot:g15837.t1